MNSRQNNFYIITGGPGVGKTTVLNELGKSGYSVVPENARKIIQEQVATKGDGLPWKNKKLYIDLMLTASVASYKLAQADYSLSSKTIGFIFLTVGSWTLFVMPKWLDMEYPMK